MNTVIISIISHLAAMGTNRMIPIVLSHLSVSVQCNMEQWECPSSTSTYGRTWSWNASITYCRLLAASKSNSDHCTQHIPLSINSLFQAHTQNISTPIRPLIFTITEAIWRISMTYRVESWLICIANSELVLVQKLLTSLSEPSSTCKAWCVNASWSK